MHRQTTAKLMSVLWEYRLLSHPLSTHFHALRFVSQVSTPAQSHVLNDVCIMLTKPNWQKDTRLKSLVSHMNPHSISKVIAFHSKDVHLGLRFFKWACKQSTYCYDIDSRLQVVKLLACDNLHGILHKVLVYLIKECCDSEVAVLKLLGAVEDSREKTGFRMNYPSYSTLLACLAKLKMGFMVFAVFKKMLEGGFVVGGIDYRTIINALCKNGFIQAGEMFFARVLKLGFVLDVYVFTSLILGNCRVGDLTEAFRVFDLMSERDGSGVNGVMYTILVHGLCEVGRLDEAHSLKEEMREKGYQPGTRVYTVLIHATCGKGMIDEAFTLIDEMIRNGCKPNVHTYTVMIDALCREAKIMEANAIFNEMLKDGLNPRIVSYNALINGYCKQGKVISAFELLGVMERRHCEPNVRTYNELMEGLCKVNRTHQAVVLLGKVIDSGLFPTEVTLNILIDGLSRAGQVSMAFKILHSMKALGLEPDHFSYTSLIDGLCEMKRVDLANGVFGVMIKKAVLHDDVTLTALIHGHCKIGKGMDAFKLFERMVKDECSTSPHTFNIILEILTKEVSLVEKNSLLGKMMKYGLVPDLDNIG